MTKVITRYFEDPAQAQAARRALLRQRVPANIVRVYTSTDGLTDDLIKRHVTDATAEAYRSRVEKGGAVVLVEAGYRPLNVAAIAREGLASMGAVPLGNLPEEIFVPDSRPGKPMNIMSDHPRFMTRDRDPDSTTYHMANWPIPLISRRKPADNFAFPRHARMADWPIPLTARLQPRDEFAFPRHARMANLIFPLTIRRKPSDRFLFARHARMANWPIALTNRRKPFDASFFPRHSRMANWPFPHLINGKTGTNALMPRAPRMANYPVPLLSSREPFDKSLIPRHGRMANLLLPLLSRRKPFDKSAFPRHARMANFLLPLIVRSEPGSSKKGGFSLSRLIGLPTLARR
ncbi:MAG: PucR family transcriptional regulator [Pseudomonadota bacterium]